MFTSITSLRHCLLSVDLFSLCLLTSLPAYLAVVSCFIRWDKTPCGQWQPLHLFGMFSLLEDFLALWHKMFQAYNFPALGLELRHCSQESPFLLVEDGVEEQGLSAECAHSCWGVAAPRPALRRVGNP